MAKKPDARDPNHSKAALDDSLLNRPRPPHFGRTKWTHPMPEAPEGMTWLPDEAGNLFLLRISDLPDCPHGQEILYLTQWGRGAEEDGLTGTGEPMKVTPISDEEIRRRYHQRPPPRDDNES
jgi:hypothetical protein